MYLSIMKRIFFTLVISLVALSHLSAQFEDKTDDAQLRHSFINNAFMGGGMTILDYDNDGWPDWGDQAVPGVRE